MTESYTHDGESHDKRPKASHGIHLDSRPDSHGVLQAFLVKGFVFEDRHLDYLEMLNRFELDILLGVMVRFVTHCDKARKDVERESCMVSCSCYCVERCYESRSRERWSQEGFLIYSTF